MKTKEEATKENLAKTKLPSNKHEIPLFKVGLHQHSSSTAVPLLHRWHGLAVPLLCPLL